MNSMCKKVFLGLNGFNPIELLVIVLVEIGSKSRARVVLDYVSIIVYFV
jgi:hypothetical protein